MDEEAERLLLSQWEGLQRKEEKQSWFQCAFAFLEGKAHWWCQHLELCLRLATLLRSVFVWS